MFFFLPFKHLWILYLTIFVYRFRRLKNRRRRMNGFSLFISHSFFLLPITDSFGTSSRKYGYRIIAFYKITTTKLRWKVVNACTKKYLLLFFIRLLHTNAFRRKKVNMNFYHFVWWKKKRKRKTLKWISIILTQLKRATWNKFFFTLLVFLSHLFMAMCKKNECCVYLMPAKKFFFHFFSRRFYDCTKKRIEKKWYH